MSEENESAPVVRYLTQERFNGSRDFGEAAEGSNQEKSGSMLGVLITVVVLVGGLAGIFLIGPTKAVNVAMGLIQSQKAPDQDKPADSFFEDPTPIPPTHPKHPEPVMIAMKAPHAPVTPPAIENPADAEQKRPRTANVRPGMLRRELLELYGAPDMKATSIENGHLIENYAYMNASRAQQMIVLEDGRVIEAGEN